MRTADVFSDQLGRTTVITHDILTEPGKIIRQRPYHIPEARHGEVHEEVWKTLEMGVRKESHSAWSSPIVMVGPWGAVMTSTVDGLIEHPNILATWIKGVLAGTSVFSTSDSLYQYQVCFPLGSMAPRDIPAHDV